MWKHLRWINESVTEEIQLGSTVSEECPPIPQNELCATLDSCLSYSLLRAVSDVALCLGDASCLCVYSMMSVLQVSGLWPCVLVWLDKTSCMLCKNSVVYFWLCWGLHLCVSSSLAVAERELSGYPATNFSLQWLLFVGEQGLWAQASVAVPGRWNWLSSCGEGSVGSVAWESSRTRDQTYVSCLGNEFLTTGPQEAPPIHWLKY